MQLFQFSRLVAALMPPVARAASAAAVGFVALVAVPSLRAQNTTPPVEEPPPKFEATFLANASNVDAGRSVWEQQCRHCHGNSAYPGKAPKLKPGTYTPDFIYDRVTYGFKGMPPWKEVFSLQQRMAVVAYIKSDSFSP
jgi:mono/diheme cytochrome c family protein